MPIPGLVSGAIMASSSSKTPQMVQIAQGVELGLYQWFLSPTTVVGGVGVGLPAPPLPVPPPVMTGTLTVVPNAGIMEGAFKANGLVGVFAPVMWVPIMIGVSLPHVIGCPSPIVGAGSFTGSLIGDPILLTSLLVSSFASVGIVGIEVPRICSALGQGIFGLFSASPPVGVIAGPVLPAPPATPISAPLVGKFI